MTCHKVMTRKTDCKYYMTCVTTTRTTEEASITPWPISHKAVKVLKHSKYQYLSTALYELLSSFLKAKMLCYILYAPPA